MNIQKEIPPAPAPTPGPATAQAVASRAQLGALLSRTGVLVALALFTLGAAVMSVVVNYRILEVPFGKWAVAIVGALDALWLIVQATEILAGNDKARARRVRYVGLLLTLVLAAIPTWDLVMTRSQDGVGIAAAITPAAIIGIKAGWWLVLPSLGRPVSDAMRTTLDEERRKVADRLEQMQAEAAHRIELLEVASALETRVTRAETAYRKGRLKAQEKATKQLHKQAGNTEQTAVKMPLPAVVADMALPTLDGWEPTAPALTAALDRSTPAAPALNPAHPSTGDAAQVNGAPGAPDADGDAPDDDAAMDATLADMASVAGVDAPRRGVTLTDAQLDLVLRYLRHGQDPALSSCRQADRDLRAAGFRASQERVRGTWRDILTREGAEDHDDQDADDPEDSTV
ncbi:hypothetical protein ACFWRZ_34315 [Streptomyces rubiginosohelvolus]|uniref:hypothetical protein n=1 Tax=Streptomyces rubiginosohelvolus TaxID=67362 RepID=UPI00365BAADC